MASATIRREFTARIHPDWASVAAAWTPLMAASRSSPFQSERWLAGWYGAFAGRPDVEPLLVEVVDADGRLALGLPLVRRFGRRLTTVEFADLGITDYNAPILGPAAPAGPAEARAAWRAVRRVLPAADLAVFTKMPGRVGDAENPLVQALPVEPSRLFGNFVATGDDYDAWLHTLDKNDRKELARFARVFTREEGARFVHATDPALARRILDWIEVEQAGRIRALGLPYLLDDPDYAGFYRAMLDRGIADGSVIVTALMHGDEVVAGLYGIADGAHYAMVRIAFTGGRWANCSPGRLVIERSMEAMHRAGYRYFDFTIGDYAHKRGFSAAHLPLFDASIALSLRGFPTVGVERAKAYVKQHPGLEKLVRRMVRRAA